jgi:hypothetical protein
LIIEEDFHSRTQELFSEELLEIDGEFLLIDFNHHVGGLSLNIKLNANVAQTNFLVFGRGVKSNVERIGCRDFRVILVIFPRVISSLMSPYLLSVKMNLTEVQHIMVRFHGWPA